MELWANILQFGAAILLAQPIWEIVKIGYKRYLLRKDRQYSTASVLNSVRDIYDVLNLLLFQTKATEALILRSHNGGGIPVVGKALYSTIEYEVISGNVAPVKNTWIKQRLDKHYIEMLSSLVNSKELFIQVYTENLPEDSILKNVYESRGIVFTLLTELFDDEHGYYYLSIPFSDHKKIDAHTKNIIRLVKQKLHDIFDKDRRNNGSLRFK